MEGTHLQKDAVFVMYEFIDPEDKHQNDGNDFQKDIDSFFEDRDDSGEEE